MFITLKKMVILLTQLLLPRHFQIYLDVGFLLLLFIVLFSLFSLPRKFGSIYNAFLPHIHTPYNLIYLYFPLVFCLHERLCEGVGSPRTEVTVISCHVDAKN